MSFFQLRSKRFNNNLANPTDKPNYTVAHFTDALKRKEVSLSHTTDSNKKKSGLTLSHSTDSNKKKSGITLSHTADALKRKQFTPNHTTDALKRSRLSRTHLTDANKKRSYSVNHTTDAYLKNPLTSTIRDNFNDSTADTALWDLSGATSELGGRVTLTYTAGSPNYSSYVSKSYYDLTGSYVFSKLVDAGNQALSTFQAVPVYLVDSTMNSRLVWYILGNTLHAQKFVGGSPTDVRADVTYDPNVHKWFRIRESSGTTYWDYSTDGLTWTNYTSESNPITVTALKVSLSAGAFGSEASGTSAIFDNLNVIQPTLVHTTDSNKRKSGITVSHSTDANKKVSGLVRSHTTDSLKRKHATLTHTTDAYTHVALVTSTISHTTDSYLRQAVTLSHSTDANKRKAYTLSHSTDANKKKSGVILQHSTDALVRKSFTLSHTSDANKKKSTTVIHTTDANKRVATTKTHTTDSRLRRIVTAKITQKIEMLPESSNITGTANTYIELPYAMTRLDTSAFDGDVTYYFEAVFRNSGAAGTTAYVELYNKTDGVSVSGSEFTEVGPPPNNFPRRRRVQVSLSGNKVYTIRVKHSTATTSTLVNAVRLVVVQQGNITKTQIHQDLGVEAGVSSTSTTNRMTGAARFLYEAAKYDGTVSVTHEAVLIATSGNTTSSGIYDETAAGVVSSSTVSTTSTSYNYQTSSPITLLDGHVYQPTSYVSAGSAVQFQSNKLVFTITGGFTKFLTYIAVDKKAAGNGNSSTLFPQYNAFVNYVQNWNNSDFAGANVIPYYEADVAINNSAQTAYSNLESYDYAAVSATNIPSSDVTRTGATTPNRVRSSASIAIPDNDLTAGIAASTGTNAARLYAAYIVLEVNQFTNITHQLSHTTDAYTRKEYSRSHTTDAFKRISTTLTHTTDTLLRKAYSLTHSTDSNKKKTTSLSHSTDSNKKKSTTVSHSTDSFLHTTATVSHTTDAETKRVISKTHTTDSYLHSSFAPTHTTDSNKKKGLNKTHTTDAYMRGANRSVHTTDANKRKVTLVAHTTDSSLRAIFVKSHTTDSFIRRSLIKVHTTDANRRKVSSVSHSTDGNKRKALQLVHTTSSVLRKVITVSHSTNTLLRARIAISHSTGSFLRKAISLAYTTDSLIRKGQLATHSTDTSLLGSSIVAHNTDANLRTNRGKKKILIDGVWVYYVARILISGTWVEQVVRYYDGTDWIETE